MIRSLRTGGGSIGLLLCAMVVGVVNPAFAADVQTAQKLQDLQEQINAYKQEMAELERRIERLQEQVNGTQAPPEQPASEAQQRAAALEQALEAIEQDQDERAGTQPSNLSARGGVANFRLIDVSLILQAVAGTSTAEGETLRFLQGGAHDPKRRGFTLQQAELSISGAVDPYFYGVAHITFTPDIVELEEAFLQTTQLPYDLKLEVGYFLTEFGRINPRHPHSWDWIDQPVIITRMFGGHGLRGAGARLAWLTPLPWYSVLHFGVQNAGNAVGFLGGGVAHAHGHGGHEHEEEHHFETTIGGRPIVDRGIHSFEDFLYLGRWVNAWDLGGDWSIQIGASALYGPNNTGPEAQTWIYGADLVLKWQAGTARRGWPFLTWQTEIIRRNFEAAAFTDPHEGFRFPANTLHDWGLYTQVLYGFTPGWAAGLRYGFATGSGASFEDGERIPIGQDPFRGDRHRISPLLSWRPTEFSRLRLQYNYDIADFLPDGQAHSVYLSFEVLLGAHAAHRY